MYKRTTTQSQQPYQVLDFPSLKRKGDQTIEFIIQDEINNTFKIIKGHNTIITIMILSDLLNDSIKKQSKPPRKLFQDFQIDNVPKLQYNYQHQNTLQQIWNIINTKFKNLNVIQQYLVNNLVVEFCIICYARKIIKDFIQSNRDNEGSDLHGNQIQVLGDYSTEIRGNLLNCLALALSLSVKIKYKDLSNQAQQSFTQIYGDKGSQNRIQIQSIGQYYRVVFPCNLQSSIKLISIQSSINIKNNTIRKNDKQCQYLQPALQQVQSLRQVQSRSVNKDQITKCLRCKGRTCQCDKTNTNKITRKMHQKSSVGPGTTSNKSIFDGMINNVGWRNMNREERVVCGGCGKAFCSCRR